MAKDASRPLECLSGRAQLEPARKGTASEHTAVVLVTGDGSRVILQRIGGNPFSDAETRELAGHEVVVEGYRVGDIFRYVKADAK